MVKFLFVIRAEICGRVGNITENLEGTEVSGAYITITKETDFGLQPKHNMVDDRSNEGPEDASRDVD